MLKKLEITSTEQAKVLAHPLRLRVIALYDDGLPRTSKQLADLLDLPPAKVHYHVRELLRVNLLELVETKEKGGVIEKYYLPVAKQFQINLNETEVGDKVTNSTRYLFLKSVLEEYQSSFLKAAELSDEKKAKMKKTQGENEHFAIKGPSLSHTHLLLNEDDIKMLQNDLHELFERWVEKAKERKNDENEGVKSYGLLLSLYEKPTKPNKGTKMILID